MAARSCRRAAPTSRRPTAGHVVSDDRERRLEERAPEQRRIEDVVSEPAEEQLAERDADAPPNAAIHIGIPAGSVSPSSMPVIAAEPSPIVAALAERRARRAPRPPTDAPTTSNALGPKKYVAIATSGIEAADDVPHDRRRVAPCRVRAATP